MDIKILALRAVAALFAVVILGLTAYDANEFDKSYCVFGYCYSGTVPAEVAYSLFAAIWTIIVLLLTVVVPMFVPALGNRVIVGAIYVLTTIFWFTSAVALAAKIGAHKSSVTWYQTLQAAVAFSFFQFVIFAGLSALIFLFGDDDDGKPLFGGGHSATAHDPNNPELQPSTV